MVLDVLFVFLTMSGMDVDHVGMGNTRDVTFEPGSSAGISFDVMSGASDYLEVK